MAGQKVEVVYSAIDRMSKKVDAITKTVNSLNLALSDANRVGEKFNQMTGEEASRVYTQVTKNLKKHTDQLGKDKTAMVKAAQNGQRLLDVMKANNQENTKAYRILKDKVIATEREIRSTEKLITTGREQAATLRKQYEASEEYRRVLEDVRKETERLDEKEQFRQERLEWLNELVAEAASKTNRYKKELVEIGEASDGYNRSLRDLVRTKKDLEGSIDALATLTGDDFLDAKKAINSEISKEIGYSRQLQAVQTRQYRQYLNMFHILDKNIPAQRELRDNIRRMLPELQNSSRGYEEHAKKLEGVRKELDRATPAVERQEKAQASLFRRFQQFVGGKGEIRSAFRDVMDFSFFRTGAVTGLKFFETMRKILAITPMVGVALGGLTQIVGALGAGLFAAAGSAGRLVGVLGLLPGLYGAIGAGFLGFQSVVGNFIDPSVSGAEQIENLSKQISAAQDRVADAKGKATELTETGLRSATQAKFGMRQDLSEKTSGADDVAKAQSNLTDLMEKQNELLEGMPPRYQEIADLVKEIKEDWRDLWITGDIGKSISRSIIRSLTAVKDLLASNEVKAGVRAYAALIGYASLLIKEVLGNDAFRMGALQVLRGAIANFRTLLDIVKELGPYIGEIAKAINRATGDTLIQVLEAIQNSSRDAESLGESVYNFIMRGVESFKAWWTALGNVISAFRILAGKGSIIEKFEGGLVSVTQRFEDWARSVDGSKVQSFFEGSTKILKGLGRVLISVGKAMGIVLGGEGDQSAVDSTVAFFDQMAGGIEKLGYWMQHALVVMGPKMVEFFSAIGGALDGEGGKLIDYMSRIVDGGVEFVKFMDKITPPGTVALIVASSAAFIGLGFAFGQLLVPIARIAAIGGAPFRWIMNLGEKVTGKEAGAMEKFSEGAARLGAGFRFAVKYAAPLGLAISAILGSALAIKDNFWGIRDSLKDTGAHIKRRLQPAIEKFADKLGGSGGTGIIDVLEDVLKVFGWITIKAGEVIAILSTEVLVGLLDTLSLALDGINDMIKAVEDFFNAESGSEAIEALWDGVVGGLKALLGSAAFIAEITLLWVAAAKVWGAAKAAAMWASSALMSAATTAIAAVTAPLVTAFTGLGATIGASMGGAMAIAMQAAILGAVALAVGAVAWAGHRLGQVASEAQSHAEGSGGRATSNFAAIREDMQARLSAGEITREEYDKVMEQATAVMQEEVALANDTVALTEDLNSRGTLTRGLMEANLFNYARRESGELEERGEALSGEQAALRSLLDSLGAGPPRTSKPEKDITKMTPEEIAADMQDSLGASGALEANQFPGYVGTEKKGAKIAWDMATVRTFVGTMADPLQRKVGELHRGILKLIADIRDVPKNNLNRIKSAWEAIAEAITEAISTALTTMETELNNALVSTGSSRIVFSRGVDQTTEVLELASGGRVPMRAGANPYKDSVPAMLTPGEVVLNRKQQEAVGYDRVKRAIGEESKGSSERRRGYAEGGMVSGAASRNSSTSGLLGPALAELRKANAMGLHLISGYRQDPIGEHPSGLALDVSDGGILTQKMSRYAGNAAGRGASGQTAIRGMIYNNKSIGYGGNWNWKPYGAGNTGNPTQDHLDHVHIWMGGPMTGRAGGSPGGDFGAFSLDLTNPGIIGGGALGAVATAVGQLAMKAINGAFGGGGGSGSGGATNFSGGLADMIRTAARAYGANAEGLLRVAQAESSMDPDIMNDWDINALRGTPSGGLFQFIEPTFRSMMPQAFDTNPSAWRGVSRNWMDPMAQALTAAWAFTHGQGSHWATFNHYGDGGHFRVNRPTPIVVGDKQPEEVRVTPTRGANKGKYSGGGRTTVINSSVNVGTLVADDEGIAQLAEKIGMKFAQDLKTARRFTRAPKDS